MKSWTTSIEVAAIVLSLFVLLHWSTTLHRAAAAEQERDRLKSESGRLSVIASSDLHRLLTPAHARTAFVKEPLVTLQLVESESLFGVPLANVDEHYYAERANMAESLRATFARAALQDERLAYVAIALWLVFGFAVTMPAER